MEALTQVPKKSIRYYEEEGLLRPARDIQNGYRNYTAEDVAVLKRVKLCRKLDLPVEEIRRIFAGELTFSEALERQKIVLAHEKNELEQKRTLCEGLIAALAAGEAPDADRALERVSELERDGVRFNDFARLDRGKKTRGVWLSVSGVALLLLAVALLVWHLNSSDPMPLWGFVLMETLLILPAVGVFLAGRTRIREINGGEEDDLGQY